MNKHRIVHIENTPFNAVSLFDFIDLVNEFKVADFIEIKDHLLKYYSILDSRFNAVASIEHINYLDLVSICKETNTSGGIIYQWYKRASNVINDDIIPNSDYKDYVTNCLTNDVKHGAKSACFVNEHNKHYDTVYEYDINNAYAYGAILEKPIRETFKTYKEPVIVPPNHKGIDVNGAIVKAGEMAISTFVVEKPDQKIIDYFTKLSKTAKDTTLTDKERTQAKNRIVITIGMMKYKDLLYRQLIIHNLNSQIINKVIEVDEPLMFNVDAIYTTVEQDELFDIGTNLGQYKKKTHTNFYISGLNYHSDQSSALRGIPKSQQGRAFEAVRPKYKYNIVKHDGEFEVWQN